MSEETARDLQFIREKWRLDKELIDRRAAELQEAESRGAAAQVSAVPEARKAAHLADARASATSSSGSGSRSRMHVRQRLQHWLRFLLTQKRMCNQLHEAD